MESKNSVKLLQTLDKWFRKQVLKQGTLSEFEGWSIIYLGGVRVPT